MQSVGENAQLDAARSIANRIENAIGRRIVGQATLRRRLLSALLADGHVLLEGVPGLAKTLSIRALAETVHGEFHRIQFTPDLLPADIVGTEVFRPQDGSFEVRKGPIFANFVLADEINRAPAKVQSALLETMQERQVTIGRETYRVPDPFFVLATQNPIEQEGTYPLPEAQTDRFLMKVSVDYPTAEEELQMLDLVTSSEYEQRDFGAVATLEELAFIRTAAKAIYVDDRVKQYVIALVAATRNPSAYGLDIEALIELGGSPRATLALYLVARSEALLSGSDYVVPQHVKNIAPDVLRHRVMPTYEAEAEGLSSDDLVQMVLEKIAVP